MLTFLVLVIIAVCVWKISNQPPAPPPIAGV